MDCQHDPPQAENNTENQKISSMRNRHGETVMITAGYRQRNSLAGSAFVPSAFSEQGFVAELAIKWDQFPPVAASFLKALPTICNSNRQSDCSNRSPHWLMALKYFAASALSPLAAASRPC